MIEPTGYDTGWESVGAGLGVPIRHVRVDQPVLGDRWGSTSVLVRRVSGRV